MPTMTKAGYVPQKPAKGPAKTPKSPKKQGRRPHPERKWTVGAALILILAISLSGLILYLYRVTGPYQASFLPGLFLSGEALDGMSYAEAEYRLSQLEEQNLSGYSLDLVCGAERITLGAEDLDLHYDIAATLDPLFAVGREQGMLSLFWQIQKSRDNPVFAEPELSYDKGAVERVLSDLKKRRERESQDAGLHFEPGLNEPFKTVAGVTGITLDTEGVPEQVWAAIAALDRASIVVPVVETRPKVTEERLLSELRCTYRFITPLGTGPAAENAELALLQWSGLELAPGASQSFNALVGPRTRENGYEAAPEPAYGEDVVGVGGGTCLAASCLYRAWLLSGLKVETRSCAAMVPGFAEPGEEAAVSDTGLDLVLANDTDLPVFVGTRTFREEDTILCEVCVYARDAGLVELSHERTVLLAPSEPEYVLDPDGTYARYRDERVLRNAAREGADVVTVRIFKNEDGTERLREVVSQDQYQPVPERFWVGREER